MNRPERFVVQRIYNNNVVLALDAHNRSVVLIGSGLGFGSSRGTLIRREDIEALYVPEMESAGKAAQALAGIPQGVIRTAQAIVRLSAPRGHPRSFDALLLPLADHLHLALERARTGVRVDMPLTWEVRTLYPEEYAMGVLAVDTVKKQLGVDLPAEEASAFALHFLSIGFARRDMEQTIRMTRSLDLIFHALEDELGHPLDRGSDVCLRFVTHLRYLFVRLADSRPTSPLPSEVVDSLASTIPGHMNTATRIARLLEFEWHTDVTRNEQAYIALHLHRLMDS